MIALVPARSGSKRIKEKNIKPLGHQPLIDWTLTAAEGCGCFNHVYVSTDSEAIAYRATQYTGTDAIMRPPHLATDDAIDRDWIVHAIETIDYRLGGELRGREAGDKTREPVTQVLPQEFCLLRPTSPFRDAACIQRAVAAWRDFGEKYDSLRAVRRVTEHPMKTWTRDTEDLDDGVFGIVPVTRVAEVRHLHSRPTQSLIDAWVQTAGLEIFRRSTVLEPVSYGPYDGDAQYTISGKRVLGFELEGPEALDLNNESDWEEAEAYLAKQTLS